MIKNTQPKGNIARRTFKLLLSPYCSQKLKPPPPPGGRVNFKDNRSGASCYPAILQFGYFENIWSDMYSKLCVQVQLHVFMIFYVKVNFWQYFIENLQFLIFWGLAHIMTP